MEDLLKRIEILEAKLKELEASSTIPFDVEKAFRGRLNPASVVGSSKTAASETQSVSEGGAASYSVAKPMDGFLVVSFNGVTRNIPFYND